jgi:hypothetical protein
MLVAALAVTMLAPTATAAKYEQSPMFQDCSAGCPEAIDFSGPSGFGWVNYTTYGPDLKLQVALRGASANTSYTIYLTCGPTHDTACGFVAVGTLLTDAYGRANANQIVVRSPFGGGVRTDHVDIIGSDGSIYVAGNINYTTS